MSFVAALVVEKIVVEIIAYAEQGATFSVGNNVFPVGAERTLSVVVHSDGYKNDQLKVRLIGMEINGPSVNFTARAMVSAMRTCLKDMSIARRL